jgi:tmRNA-binding protein
MSIGCYRKAIQTNEHFAYYFKNELFFKVQIDKNRRKSIHKKSIFTTIKAIKIKKMTIFSSTTYFK